MNAEGEYAPLALIMTDLGRICAAKRSGTAFIVTDDNRMARFSILDGEIVFVYFANKRGEDALPLISAINSGRLRFQEGAVKSTARSPLPPTTVLLTTLAGNDLIGIERETAPVDVNISTRTVASLPPDIREVIKAELAEFIGPVATVVCADHLDKVPDLITAIDVLAKEIGDPEIETRFRKRIRDRLHV